MLEIRSLLLPNNKSLNLKLNTKEQVGLMGANGSGKSLALKAIAGLLPSKFEVFNFESVPVTQLGPTEFRKYVLYHPSVNLHFQGSCQQFWDWPFRFQSRKEESHGDFFSHKIRETFRLEQDYQELSSGQKQLIALFRSLSLARKILLLDEPFSHMDEVTKKRSIQILKELIDSTNISLILVSHLRSDIDHLGLDYKDVSEYLGEHE